MTDKLDGTALAIPDSCLPFSPCLLHSAWNPHLSGVWGISYLLLTFCQGCGWRQRPLLGLQLSASMVLSVCLKYHTRFLLMSPTGVGAQCTLPATITLLKLHISAPAGLSL